MKTKLMITAATAAAMFVFTSCGNNSQDESANNTSSDATANEQPAGGQSAINDDVSQPNVVKVAINSKDHTTLVTAVKAADLVNPLSNNGPFTVFAPTNAAFAALPAGTVEGLLKPDQKDALTNILYHHVIVSTFKTENLKDGQVLGMFDGTSATIHVKDGKYMIDDAHILASVPASNGIVHVIDKVILPPAKK